MYMCIEGVKFVYVYFRVPRGARVTGNGIGKYRHAPEYHAPKIEFPSHFMSLRESWKKWHESWKYDIQKVVIRESQGVIQRV